MMGMLLNLTVLTIHNAHVYQNSMLYTLEIKSHLQPKNKWINFKIKLRFKTSYLRQWLRGCAARSNSKPQLRTVPVTVHCPWGEGILVHWLGPEHWDSPHTTVPPKPEVSTTKLPRKRDPCPACFLLPLHSKSHLCLHLIGWAQLQGSLGNLVFHSHLG